MMAVLADERKLSRVTAKSTEPIQQVMRVTKDSLDELSSIFNPVKPRVLFSALGERHAEQISDIANAYGIPCDFLHYSMTESRIRKIRNRYENASGDLQGIVQLRMLGQGYDLPPISVVVPMRPYGSFGEFYQFIGRGIRVIHHPSFQGRIAPTDQKLHIVYHAELGLDDHIKTIYRENDMDPSESHDIPASWRQKATERKLGTSGRESAGRPEAFVLFQKGTIEERVVHDKERMEQRKREREMEALAQQYAKYAKYAESTEDPVKFEQFVEIKRSASQ